jgi:hypothetical protein
LRQRSVEARELGNLSGGEVRRREKYDEDGQRAPE